MPPDTIAQLVIEIVLSAAILGVSLTILEAFFGSGR